MNLGQNKLVVGLGAGLLLIFGVFTWFLYQSYDAFGVAEQEFQDNAKKLYDLQHLPLYPEKSNLKVMEEQKKIADESVIALHKQLVPLSFPLEAMTPEQFQDALNASVKTLVEKAAKANVKLSDKFYLGFSEYQTAIPRPEAAAVLGRQLKCIELAVDTMIEKKVISIGEIRRPHLPEEDKQKAAQAQATPPPNPRARQAEKPAPELLSKYPFEIQFVTDEKAFQTVLNELSKTDKQFFIIRPLEVKNQSDKSPKKNEKVAAAAAADAKSDKLSYVLGAEKLNVTLRFDAVVFASNLPK